MNVELFILFNGNNEKSRNNTDLVEFFEMTSYNFCYSKQRAQYLKFAINYDI